jgi:hypothetical protein
MGSWRSPTSYSCSILSQCVVQPAPESRLGLRERSREPTARRRRSAATIGSKKVIASCHVGPNTTQLAQLLYQARIFSTLGPYFHRRTGPTLPRPTYCTLQQHALGSPRAACARATDRDTFPAPVQKTLVPHTGKWPNFSTVHGHLSPGAAASAPCPYEACTERKDRGRDVRRRDTYRCGQCVHCASGPAETGGSCAADTRRPAGVAVSEDRRLPCPRGLRPDCDWMDGEDRAGRKEGTAGSGSSQARRVGRGVAVPTSL